MTTEHERTDERLRLLAENTSDVIWTMDLAGTFTYISPSVELQRGYTQVEALAQSLDEALTPTSARIARLALRDSLSRVARGQRVRNARFEFEQPRKDGSTVWTEVIASGMYDAAGRLVGVLGISRDVGERLRIDRAIRESEERFRLLVDVMPFPLVLTRAADSAIVYINRQASQLFGVSQDAVVGRLVLDFYSSEADRTALIEEIQRTGHVREREILGRRENGEPFWGSVSAVVTTIGGELTIVAGIDDITSRKHDDETARHLLSSARRHAEEMTTLLNVGLTLASGLDSQAVLKGLLEQCQRVLPMDAFYVATFDPETGLIEHPFLYDLGEFRRLPARDIRISPGLSGRVIERRTTVYIPDLLAPDPAAIRVISAGGSETRSYIGVPLVASDRVIGVLSIQSYEPGAYSPDHIRLLETIATQAAIALENSRLYEQAQREIGQRRQVEESLRQANQALQGQLAEIEMLQASLREQAIRDPLTGLCNRRFLEESLPRELARCARENLPISIALVDVDHFKLINDGYGHQAGDAVLQALAEMIRAETRATDIFCRYGGDEFVVVLPGAQADVTMQRAEHWRHAFAALAIDLNGLRIAATLSLGVATVDPADYTPDELIATADRALYAAKSAGRNRTAVAG
jgi:diguanylate cyclase (GGDEF)-like protein/PAS domain S-box-containing protein